MPAIHAASATAAGILIAATLLISPNEIVRARATSATFALTLALSLTLSPGHTLAALSFPAVFAGMLIESRTLPRSAGTACSAATSHLTLALMPTALTRMLIATATCGTALRLSSSTLEISALTVPFTART
jgi:hypothetical protein